MEVCLLPVGILDLVPGNCSMLDAPRKAFLVILKQVDGQPYDQHREDFPFYIPLGDASELTDVFRVLFLRDKYCSSPLPFGWNQLFF